MKDKKPLDFTAWDEELVCQLWISVRDSPNIAPMLYPMAQHCSWNKNAC